MTTLLSNASATGDWATVTGGKYLVRCVGTGFGTVKLQIKGPDPSETAIDVEDGSFTANGAKLLSLPNGAAVRGNVATATGVYLDLLHTGLS